MAEVIDTRTEGRGWLLPNPLNRLRDDVTRLVAGLQMADGDVTSILMQLGQKAALLHEHGMADIVGLADALNSKANKGQAYAFSDLVDVDISVSANGQVVMKQGEIWIPVALQIGHVSGLETAINGKLSAATLTAAPAKATLVDADRLVIINSAGSVISTSLFSVLKAALKTINDAFYATAAHVHAAATNAAAGFMSAADKTKLDGIAAGATANATDAVNRARANHTGTQAVATITGLGSLATKNDATLTTDVLGILPVANGGTGASSFPGVLKATNQTMAVGWTGAVNVGSGSDYAVGATIAGSIVYPLTNDGPAGALQTGTWRNDGGSAVTGTGALRRTIGTRIS